MVSPAGNRSHSRSAVRVYAQNSATVARGADEDHGRDGQADQAEDGHIADLDGHVLGRGQMRGGQLGPDRAGQERAGVLGQHEQVGRDGQHGQHRPGPTGDISQRARHAGRGAAPRTALPRHHAMTPSRSGDPPTRTPARTPAIRDRTAGPRERGGRPRPADAQNDGSTRKGDRGGRGSHSLFPQRTTNHISIMRTYFAERRGYPGKCRSPAVESKSDPRERARKRRQPPAAATSPGGGR